ncbi:DUF1573 domain-containing protein [Flavicella sp.]|uniref:DUF1573 domain-containing protein n=1 Tax=Flavicella sp. TaxID=2957742 RepID=UPI003016C7FE
MKKILIAITLFISAFSISAQTAEPTEDFDTDTPNFKFEEEVIDYGKINKNTDGNRVFKFVNTGNSPLIITNAKGSCGCTVPTYNKEPIMPGDSGEIKVKYATSRVGRFSKTITLTSNANEPKKVLRIKGEVLKLTE